MSNIFRLVTLLEGLSYIILLFIAVPIKYLGNEDKYVKIFGMPHGVLFVLYIVLALILKNYKKWDLKDLSIILFASILPFGTFYVDWKYLKK